MARKLGRVPEAPGELVRLTHRRSPSTPHPRRDPDKAGVSTGSSPGASAAGGLETHFEKPCSGNECSLQGFSNGNLLGTGVVTGGDTLFRILRGEYPAVSSPAPGGVQVPPHRPHGLRQGQPLRARG